MSDYDDRKPNQLPQLKRDEVLARAQKIYDVLGEPPYDRSKYGADLPVEALAVVSEFVFYWRPFLVVKS